MSRYPAGWIPDLIDSTPEEVTVTAAENIAAFKAVTAAGNVANSSNTAHYGKVVGIAEEAIANGFSGVIAVTGMITNSGWSWTTGSSIFLNGTSLSMTPASSGFSQVLGVSKSSTTIFVSLSDPVLL